MAAYSMYFSPTGGTKKVADCLASAWADAQETVQEVDLSVFSGDYAQYHFSEKDVCLITFPVFEGRIPKIILNRLREMTPGHTPCIIAAVFGNRAVDDALLEAKNELLAMGFFPFAAVSAVAQHSSLYMYGTGRPDNDDRAELHAFSAKLKAAAQHPDKVVDVPGNIPYIIIPLKPTYPLYDADKCTHCMLCANKCPANAIQRSDLSIDTTVCVNCKRCIAVCPTKARHDDAAKLQAAAEFLAQRFAGRKPNILYLA